MSAFSSNQSNLDIAMLYAERGWRVLPIWTVSAGKCLCPKDEACRFPGKHPRTRNGVHAATVDGSKLRSWKWETANIGIATGRESNLLVLDVDPRNGGDATFDRLVQELGELPDGPVVETGGGGRHHYFAFPAGAIATPDGWNGIDLKGDGGYVVAPPSRHISGQMYEWRSGWQKGESMAVQELPASWLDVLNRGGCYIDSVDDKDIRDNSDGKRTTETTNGHPAKGSTAFTERTAYEHISDAIEKTVPKFQGQRHKAVFQFARFLKRHSEIAAWPLPSLRSAVDRWFDALVSRVGADRVQATADENWFDFAEGWDKVRHAGEHGLLLAALARAQSADMPAVAMTYRNEATRLLIKFCRELQREVGDKPFYLATSVIAKLFNLSQRMTPWRWLDGLVRDGVLELVERGDAQRAGRIEVSVQGGRGMIPKTIKPEHVTVLVDTREQQPLDLAPLRTRAATLPTGDYSVAGLEHVVAVERKSLPDLLACVGTERERFDREVQRLLAYPVRALVVESSWAEIEAGEWASKITPAAAVGSLLGWIAHGLPVIMAGNHERAGRFVGRLLFTAARRRWREAANLIEETIHKTSGAKP